MIPQSLPGRQDRLEISLPGLGNGDKVRTLDTTVRTLTDLGGLEVVNPATQSHQFPLFQTLTCLTSSCKLPPVNAADCCAFAFAFEADIRLSTPAGCRVQTVPPFKHQQFSTIPKQYITPSLLRDRTVREYVISNQMNHAFPPVTAL